MPIMMKNGHLFGEGNGTDSATTETADRAEKALQDNEGNPIDETYADADSLGSLDIKLLEIINNAAFHNSIFMGRDITEKYTNGSLYTNIANGTFEDLFIGDYIKASYNGVEKTFRLAGFNSLYNQGDNSVLTAPHAVVVPDEALETATMNSSNTTSNGISGAAVISGAIATINTRLGSIFSSHLLSKRELVCHQTNSEKSAGMTTLTGSSSSWQWVSVQSYLMSEMEIYGTAVFGASGHDVASAYSQFPLFALAPEFINTGYAYWLRAVVSSANFANVLATGVANSSGAATSMGIRPRFVIG